MRHIPQIHSTYSKLLAVTEQCALYKLIRFYLSSVCCYSFCFCDIESLGNGHVGLFSYTCYNNYVYVFVDHNQSVDVVLFAQVIASNNNDNEERENNNDQLRYITIYHINYIKLNWKRNGIREGAGSRRGWGVKRRRLTLTNTWNWWAIGDTYATHTHIFTHTAVMHKRAYTNYWNIYQKSRLNSIATCKYVCTLYVFVKVTIIMTWYIRSM